MTLGGQWGMAQGLRSLSSMSETRIEFLFVAAWGHPCVVQAFEEQVNKGDIFLSVSHSLTCLFAFAFTLSLHSFLVSLSNTQIHNILMRFSLVKFKSMFAHMYLIWSSEDSVLLLWSFLQKFIALVYKDHAQTDWGVLYKIYTTKNSLKNLSSLAAKKSQTLWLLKWAPGDMTRYSRMSGTVSWIKNGKRTPGNIMEVGREDWILLIIVCQYYVILIIMSW